MKGRGHRDDELGVQLLETARRRRGGAEVSGPAGLSAAEPTPGVLALQRSAGNIAVASVLNQQNDRPVQQRGSQQGFVPRVSADDLPEGARVAVQRQTGGVATHTLSVTGVLAAGGPLSPPTIVKINDAATKVPAKFRRFVAYATYVNVGGSLAWRANNPGNLRSASTSIAKVNGASGTFAVFATMEDGRAAQKALYLRVYGSQTVREAVTSLTPPNENNTAAYLVMLENQGVDLDATVKSQIAMLMSAIEANEGMIKGVVVVRQPKSFID